MQDIEPVFDPVTMNLSSVEEPHSIEYDGTRVRTIESKHSRLTCTTDGCDYGTLHYRFERDPGGRLNAVRSTGVNGDLRVTYDGARVRSLIRDDSAITFRYHPDGRLASERYSSPSNHLENEITYQYDERGRAIGTTSTDGERESFLYDARGHLARYELRSFPKKLYTIDYAFDDQGRPIRATTNDGQGSEYSTSWSYDCK